MPAMRLNPALSVATLAVLAVLSLPGFPGDTSLNSSLQREVTHSMATQHGSFVVVDVVSRTILAAHGMDIARRLEAPGSTLKPFLLMALLESGELDASQRLICRRTLRIKGAELDCTHPAQVKELDAADAIAYSCNSYFAQVVLRLQMHELVGILRRAGFDSPTGLAESEAVGKIHPPRNEEELQLEALGVRGIEVTPLEVLEAYRKLALRKRSGEIGLDGSVFDGLENSVAFGMAHASYVSGMRIAGKTGTSVSYNTSHTHDFFAGYAPADMPEIAVVVYLENGRGTDAAAVAQPVLEAFSRLRAVP